MLLNYVRQRNLENIIVDYKLFCPASLQKKKSYFEVNKVRNVYGKPMYRQRLFYCSVDKISANDPWIFYSFQTHRFPNLYCLWPCFSSLQIHHNRIPSPFPLFSSLFQTSGLHIATIFTIRHPSSIFSTCPRYYNLLTT